MAVNQPPGGPPGRLPVDLRPRRLSLLPYNDLVIDQGRDDQFPIDPRGFQLTLGMIYGLGPTEMRVLRTDDAGSLQVTTAGQVAPGPVLIALANAVNGQLNKATSLGDGASGNFLPAVGGLVFNGTFWDQMRSIAALDGTLTSTGVEAVTNAPIIYDQQGPNVPVPQVALQKYRLVSGLNAAQASVFNLRGSSTRLAIISVASAGTANLTVEVSTDNSNWTLIDTIAAALTIAKDYSGATVGATVAVSPLAFQFVRITAGAAGVGNTTTLTISAK